METTMLQKQMFTTKKGGGQKKRLIKEKKISRQFYTQRFTKTSKLQDKPLVENASLSTCSDVAICSL
jgi:hypothetical protein